MRWVKQDLRYIVQVQGLLFKILSLFKIWMFCLLWSFAHLFWVFKILHYNISCLDYWIFWRSFKFCTRVQCLTLLTLAWALLGICLRDKAGFTSLWSVHRGSELGLVRRTLEILSNFWVKGPELSFCTGPINYVASPLQQSKFKIQWWIKPCIFFLSKEIAVVAFILQLFWFILSFIKFKPTTTGLCPHSAS